MSAGQWLRPAFHHRGGFSLLSLAEGFFPARGTLRLSLEFLCDGVLGLAAHELVSLDGTVFHEWLRDILAPEQE